MKDIVLLGSTGSVGHNVLDIVSRYPEKFRIKAIATGANVETLSGQARSFRPDIAVTGDPACFKDLKDALPEGTEAAAGGESLEHIASGIPADIVFIAISGTAALKPLVAALKAGRTVALASKEPVVSAGMIIRDLAEKHSARILPVDSEHSAIMQCLGERAAPDVRTLYITGTGGSLRGRKKEEFDSLSIEEVLAHPKWNMGRKITVDSATLMNKGLEVIEARWLFDVPGDRIRIVIHPEAIVHSMVEFLDGTIRASMFCPDMRFPILSALSFPEMVPSDLPRVDIAEMAGLTFSEPDLESFPALGLAFRALEEGGTVPAVLNGANETAVKLFLDGKIRFTEITALVESAIAGHKKTDNPSLDDIMAAEKCAMETVLALKR